MSKTTAPRRAQRRVAVPVIVAGGLSSLLLAFSFTPTFSALTAAITNNTNTAGTGSLIMEEKSGSSTCTSGATGTATCTTINKYGGTMTMKPGDTSSVTITLKNTGTINAASLAVKADPCVEKLQSDNTTVAGGTLCSRFNVTVTPTVPVTGDAAVGTSYTDTAVNFGSATPGSLATAVKPGGTVQVVITATLSASADATNQGHYITQPITWTFNA